MHKNLGLLVSHAYATSLVASLSVFAACRGVPSIDGKSSDTPAASPGATLPGSACPLTSQAQWQGFLAQSADDDRWVRTCEDSACDAEFYRAVDQGVRATLAACDGVIQQNPALAACTQHFRSFVPTWMRMHDSGSYGFSDANAAYLAREEADDRPAGMMQIPAALIAALPHRANVEAVARASGWRYLTHDSALVGGRIFVNVRDPADRFDQWILFNVDIDANGTASADVDTSLPVSMLVVQKKNAAGAALAKVRLNFRDHHIVDAGAGSFGLKVAEDGNGKCYGCHPSGVRRLLPIRTNLLEAGLVKGEAGYDPTGAAAAPPDFGYTRLQEFNDRLAGYGLPDWDGEVEPADHGPALGADQGCTQCHNGTDRGLLTVSTSMVQLQEKIETELAMPPAAGIWTLVERSITKTPPLTTAEQATLDQATMSHTQVQDQFMAGRLPALKAWLLQTACD